MDDIIAISFETELGEDAVYRGAFTVVFDDLDPETPTPGPLPLGAEVAKRVDLYAVALHNGLTVDQLLHLDLSYTPALGSPSPY